MRNLAVEIDRLDSHGVRFCISICGDGFIARVGDYLNEPAPSKEVRTVEEAIQWIAHTASLSFEGHWSN